MSRADLRIINRKRAVGESYRLFSEVAVALGMNCTATSGELHRNIGANEPQYDLGKASLEVFELRLEGTVAGVEKEKGEAIASPFRV